VHSPTHPTAASDNETRPLRIPFGTADHRSLMGAKPGASYWVGLRRPIALNSAMRVVMMVAQQLAPPRD